VSCTDHAVLHSELWRVVSQNVRKNVGICLRLDEVDVDAYFLTMCSIAMQLLPQGEDSNVYDVRNLLQSMITFGTEEDVVDRLKESTKFQDISLEFGHAHRESAYDLQGIFDLGHSVDLSNHQQYSLVRLIIGARIRGEI
jgi:hypothetical protein